MTSLEKRLARSNARYALLPRSELFWVTTRSASRIRAAARASARRTGSPALRSPTASPLSRSAEPLARTKLEVPILQDARRIESEDDARLGEGTAAANVLLWRQLLHAHDLMLREVRRELQSAATIPQFDVLVQLEDAPEGMTLAHLSRRLLVTPGNLTGIVGRLERDRLVRREGDPLDGRAFRVRLTLRGRSHVRRLARRHAKLIAYLLGGLSPHDRAALGGLLRRLREDLERRGPR